MKRLKLVWVPFLLLLSSLMMFMPRVAAAEDPVRLLNSVADQMISGLKSHQMSLKTNRSQVYGLADRIVVPHADLDYMSKRVIPPQIWNQATPTQRSEFKNEFTTLLVRTYASALADYTDQTIRFYPVRGGYQGRATVQVNSQIIRSDGPSIPVTYSLVSNSGGWKLYDMAVEGVSMLASFRSQFADKLSEGNMDDLISALKSHNQGNGG